MSWQRYQRLVAVRTFAEEAPERKQTLSRASDSLAESSAIAHGASRLDAFLPYLATSLDALGTCFRAAERPHDAREAFAEGIWTLQPAFLALPSAFGALMGGSLTDFLTVSKDLDEPPDIAILASILAKFEEMKSNEPDTDSG
ncbi:MAG: hypothetical protein HY706_13640 [Candidatus Hydrogenedentes bacterium]|nr:hypothetical protein [Candidatus Hydrogenedentota bacterium]